MEVDGGVEGEEEGGEDPAGGEDMVDFLPLLIFHGFDVHNFISGIFLLSV